MAIVGVSLESTAHGRKLRQGGTAVLGENGIVAVSEERVRGLKYAGGFDQSFAYLRGKGIFDPVEISAVGISSCCENLPIQSNRFPRELAPNAEIVAVDHHFSHAALAFHGSGFERALVCVIDSGGNVLGDLDGPEWWKFPRQQQSYFIGAGDTLELIDADFTEPLSFGLGEFYRAATYFLGWHTSLMSSKTMALAAHGKRGAIAGNVFAMSRGALSSPVDNDPSDPIGRILALADQLGIDLGEPRTPGAEILQVHKDFAAFAQETLEQALLEKVLFLKKRHKIDKICLSGGVALNVVANASVRAAFPGGVYVPSAPGDEGQCLGNAIALAKYLRPRAHAHEIKAMTKTEDAYLGPVTTLNSAAVATALAVNNARDWVVFETTDYAEVVAGLLASGSAVCTFQERSEFGPRALGARSILSDPRNGDTIPRLNSIKGREWFLPFAPAIIAERTSEWFATPEQIDSPFMSFAVGTTSRFQREAPAVMNNDRTSRVQTVSEDSSTEFAKILKSFERKTGVPLLLNTSFNAAGEPIVESLDQAVATFQRMPINAMAVGRFVIVKSLSPDARDLPIVAGPAGLDLEVHRSGKVRKISGVSSRPFPLIRRLQHLTKSVVFVRTELPLFGPYLGWMREGKKVTTIRFRKGAVEVPYSRELPLFETQDFGVGNRDVPTDHVVVTAIRYQIFGELTVEDAQKDGFEDLDDMRSALHEIYPALQDEDWVTVYDIQLLSMMD